MIDDSILLSVKKHVGIADDDTGFDDDLIDHINTVFSVLTQMGAGPKEGYAISDYSDVWTDYLQNNALLSMVKSYMYLKVKKIFDPATSGSVSSASDELIAELESRISYTVDPGWEDIED